MKIIFLLLMSLQGAFALPILNESEPTNTIYTVYKDHQDSDLYYISPNYMTVGEEEGEPLFSYFETKNYFKKPQATIQMIFRVNNYDEELEKAKDHILRHNPKARFALVPFAKSEINFNNPFGKLIANHSCTHLAGEYSAEQECVINFTAHGRIIFINNIQKRLAMVLNFRYTIIGVNKKADNSFEDTQREFSIAGRVNGNHLSQFPHLFTDWRGYQLNF